MSIVKELFLKYIQIDTQSAHDAKGYPSTAKQMNLASVLAADCRAMGLSEVEVWEAGYVTATLPANTQEPRPVVGFLAHMDTSPDFAGHNVKAMIHNNYDGADIALPGGITLSPAEFPALADYVGHTLITTDGTTLLGADDKAGIAEILAAMNHLLRNPQIKHGAIRIAFTPDEEVGRGVDFFDVKRFGADFAYTIDGGAVGELEYESFHAARAKMTIAGKSVHPGYAKGIMVNAAQIAADMAGRFPQNETPATTEGREGYFHLTALSGGVEAACMEYILRDFTQEGINRRKDFVLDLVMEINDLYGKGCVTLNLYDEYANMAEVLENKTHIIELAANAMRSLGIAPVIRPIRGGTDGSRLSFMGLPCPNLFTGGQNPHGPYEFVSVEAMEAAAAVIVRIAEDAAR